MPSKPVRNRDVSLTLILILTCCQGVFDKLPIEAAAPPAGSPAAERTAPGTVRLNPNDGLKYVWISPGTFMMGCSPGDSKCTEIEKPAHQVTITKGFWMGQTVVPLGAYERFSQAAGHPMSVGLFSIYPTGLTDKNMPIVNVTWNDAQAYCRWAGGRLPSEAEWEYAARGGSTGATYGPLDAIAWHVDNSGGYPHEVGQKQANAFGLYDTMGSVFEWVNDWYDENYYRTGPAQDPTGPKSGESHILRGGSWMNHPMNARVSFRLHFPPDQILFNFGFRCNMDMLAP